MPQVTPSEMISVFSSFNPPLWALLACFSLCFDLVSAVESRTVFVVVYFVYCLEVLDCSLRIFLFFNVYHHFDR